MRVLGLDPSLTNYGWALHNSTETGAQRCEARGRFRTKPREFADEVSRYVYLRSCVSELIERVQPDALGVEHPVFAASYSEGLYGLFLFTLEAVRAAKRDAVSFLPPQVKRFAREKLGRPKGWKMQKADMVEAARLDSGGGRWDHNEADAYHVACFAARFWESGDASPYEAETFARLRESNRAYRWAVTQAPPR